MFCRYICEETGEFLIRQFAISVNIAQEVGQIHRKVEFVIDEAFLEMQLEELVELHVSFLLNVAYLGVLSEELSKDLGVRGRQHNGLATATLHNQKNNFNAA